MKKFTLVFIIIITSLFSFGQTNEVKFSTIKKVADRTAQSLWGNVSDGEIFPLYSKDDKIIAYRFNFAFDKPFPDKETLIENCKTFYENGDKDSHWGIGKYGYIMVSARKDMDVIQSYSDVLSPEYAEGFKMRELAKEKLGSNASLKKVYYINFENQWFCFTNGADDIYVKVFPKPEAVSKKEFYQIVDNKEGVKTGDFSSKWDKYISGNVQAGKSQVWIPNHDGYCKFYDWSYGCGPTAAAMLLSWWDFNSINTATNYSKLVDYHFQRPDIGGAMDYQVPNVQKELAIAMNTDTVSSGGTVGWMIAPGFDQVCDDNGYDFFCQRHIHDDIPFWYINKIKSEIGIYQRPIFIEIPGHFECCVAYDEAAEQIGVHNTWWGSVEWRVFTDVIRVYTVEAGGANGNPVNLISPLGDVSYNGNGNGGSYKSNSFREISWYSDYSNHVSLLYSTNGGHNWTTITSNTPNDGVYDWKIPTGINSSECRIQIKIIASDGTLLGADGSFGNFEIIPGGSVDILISDIDVLAWADPSYFQFSPDYSTWCAVGVGLRPDLPGEDWDIYIYDDNNFSNVIASSMYGESYLDFIVLDGHKAPSQYWGIKFDRYSGIGNVPVEFENGNETLTLGDNPDTWPYGDVVEMYDVFLEPGSYKFDLDITSGLADLGFAIYSSTASSYCAGKSSNLAISDNTGAGVYESFTATVATADYYGVCVWSNDYNSCDYNINIKGAGTWTGAMNNDWHNPGNWVAGIVPDATMDVSIPNVTNKCWVYGPDAACKNLTIEAGTGNYLRIYNSPLYVNGDLTIFAQLMMDNSNGSLIVDGNVDWNNNSTANITANSLFQVFGHWFFNSGANAQLGNGTVNFVGDNLSEVKSKSASCSFNSIYINKNYNALKIISDASQALVINGDLNIQTNSGLSNDSQQDIICRGNFYNSGYYYLSDVNKLSTFIFDGTNQFIYMFSANGYFNHLLISPSASVTLGGGIHTAGDLIIESGIFDTQGNTIIVEGNWTNNVGPDAFIEGTGRVIFSGTDIQNCSDEVFNILEFDNPPGALYVSGTNVECAAYDWTADAIDVFNGGLFTANDLIDNGIYGKYILSDVGVINLTNNDGYVDLDGEIYINNGTMNVYGGTTPSYWPYDAGAKITMIGGVLDFHDQGIYIYNSPIYALTENITGGIIRTAGNFEELRGDFNPEGGTVELCGNNNSHISQTTGSNYYNLTINKSAGDNLSSNHQNNIIEYRDGTKEIITKGITVTADSNLVIHRNFTIDVGIFDAPDLMEIGGSNGGDWVNNVTPEVFFEGTGTVIFKGEGYQNCTTEDFFNLVVNQQSWGYLLVESGQTVTCQSYRWLSGGIAATDGTFTALDLFDNGIYGNYFVNGSNGVINLYQDPSGWVDLDGSITIYDGEMNIYGGTDYSYWPLISDVGLTMSGGVLNFENDFGIILYGASSYTLSTDITGGTIRTSGSFYGNSPDFTPTGGNVELYGGNDVYVGIDGGSYFHNLTINKTVTKGGSSAPLSLTDRNGNVRDVTLSQTVYANADFTINGNLTIETGLFSTDMYCTTVNQNVEINNGATYYIGDYGVTGASLQLNNNSSLNVNNGGTIILEGGGGYEAVVSHTSGYYEFNVNTGGTISADTAVFEYMGTPYGINIKDGATVYPENCFSFCEFQYGDPSVTNGALLTINNDQDLIFENSMFPTFGTDYNVRKDGDQGSVTFKDFTGDFSGEDYDLDTYDRIEWFVPEFTISPTSFYFTPFADTAILTISSNVEWTLDAFDWMYVSPESGNGNAAVNVIVEENGSPYNRTGYIDASADGFPDQTIYIEQEGVQLSVMPAGATVPYEAGSMPFEVSSNTNWSVVTSDEWLSVLPETGSLDGTVTLSYEENPFFFQRDGYINFISSSGVIVEIPIYQEAAVGELTVNPPVQNVSNDAGITTFNTTSNDYWWVDEDVDWFYVTPISGYGDNTLTVIYTENTSLSSRTGDITINCDHAPSVTVTVNQGGANSQYHFVKVGGAGTQDGTSWDNASPSIQDMLDIAESGDSVWVATGTYYPDSMLTGYIAPTDRLKTFLFPHDSVRLFGGFAGNEDPETFDLNSRDFSVNETILSGDIGVPGDSLDNCYHVMYITGDTATVIDGFTIEKGQADHPNYDLFYYGAAIFARKSIFELKNMIFRDNYTISRGNVFLGRNNEDCHVLISNSLFENNISGQGGGGIGMSTHGTDLTVDNCEFVNNTGYGGGIYFYGGTLSLANSTFTANYGNSGGAVAIEYSQDFLIQNCIFDQNTAYVSGGAIYMSSYIQNGNLSDCYFTGNQTSYNGGALSFYHSSIEMNRLVFESNNSYTGGAIYYDGNGNIILNNSLFYNNHAIGGGGAIFSHGVNSHTISNTTFVGDTANWGGALFLEYSSPKIFNTIIWNNKGLNSDHQVVISNDEAEPEFYYCDVEGGKEGFGGNGAGANYSFDYDNAYNMDSDPLFTNAAAGNFGLTGFSPCINNGTPAGTTGSPYPYIGQSGGDWILYYDGSTDTLGTTDLANNPRVYDNTIDIGGYEAQSVFAGTTLNLIAGWNGLSSYIMPANNTIEDVFFPVSGDFIIAATMTGIYYPAGPINTINTWESQSAYKLKMSANAMLPVIGNEETNKTMALSGGWSLVPVISNTPVDADFLFMGADVELVKDVAGMGILWPQYGINTLGNLIPGKAYFARMNSAGSINFPPNVKNATSVLAPEIKIPKNPWTGFITGPSTHAIVVLANGMSGVITGDVIGLFAEDGNCYGISEISSLSENVVISAYADDPYTFDQDGFVNGGSMIVKLFRPQTNEVFEIMANYDYQQPNTGFFKNEGISAITSFKISATGINGSLESTISIYPNPSNGIVEISGIEKFEQIEIFNSNGKNVKFVSTENVDYLKLNLAGLPPGVYQVKFMGKNSTVVKKWIRK